MIKTPKENIVIVFGRFNGYEKEQKEEKV